MKIWILDVDVVLQSLLEAWIRPDLGQIGLPTVSAGGTWSHRRCIMSDGMKNRRKINNAMSRRAAARRVQEKVSEHDEQVVLFIWGARVLGWSLRRIAAALDASIAPPGQRAGYRMGKWTAAAVQRICRRYEIRTDRPAYPPASLLRYIRGGVTLRQRVQRQDERVQRQVRHV